MSIVIITLIYAFFFWIIRVYVHNNRHNNYYTIYIAAIFSSIPLNSVVLPLVHQLPPAERAPQSGTVVLA